MSRVGVRVTYGLRGAALTGRQPTTGRIELGLWLGSSLRGRWAKEPLKHAVNRAEEDLVKINSVFPTPPPSLGHPPLRPPYGTGGRRCWGRTVDRA